MADTTPETQMIPCPFCGKVECPGGQRCSHYDTPASEYVPPKNCPCGWSEDSHEQCLGCPPGRPGDPLPGGDASHDAELSDTPASEPTIADLRTARERHFQEVDAPEFAQKMKEMVGTPASEPTPRKYDAFGATKPRHPGEYDPMDPPASEPPWVSETLAMIDRRCKTCGQKRFEPNHYVGGNPEVGWVRCPDQFHPTNSPRPSGDTAPVTPMGEQEKEIRHNDARFKKLMGIPKTPTGPASEDVARCPTCGWGRLKPCPDKWHTECDARVAETVRAFAEWYRKHWSEFNWEDGPPPAADRYLASLAAKEEKG